MSFKIKLSLLRYFKLFYNKIKKEISKNFFVKTMVVTADYVQRDGGWKLLANFYWVFDSFFASLIPQIPCQKLCHCHLIKDFFGVKSKPSTRIKSILKISLQHPTLSIYFCFFFIFSLFASYPFLYIFLPLTRHQSFTKRVREIEKGSNKVNKLYLLFGRKINKKKVATSMASEKCSKT